MDMSSAPQTPEEYITLVRQLAAITSQAMAFVEQQQPVEQKSLDYLAANIATIACLRGDSGIYNETRPQGLGSHQQEMYALEDMLRARLLNLGYAYPSV